MLLLVHTFAGVAFLVAGALAMRYANRKLFALPDIPTLRTIRLVTWTLGIALGGASLMLADEIGYDIALPEGTGRVVGIPFLVAFFDAEGSDYVGWITYVGVVGNVTVWLLVPQLLLALYLKAKGGRVTPNTSLERTRAK